MRSGNRIPAQGTQQQDPEPDRRLFEGVGLMGRVMVTVSGPGCDEKRDAPELGLSLAINKANECAMRREEATFYVRNVDGNVVGQAESFTDGSVNVYGSMPLVEVDP